MCKNTKTMKSLTQRPFLELKATIAVVGARRHYTNCNALFLFHSFNSLGIRAHVTGTVLLQQNVLNKTRISF